MFLQPLNRALALPNFIRTLRARLPHQDFQATHLLFQAPCSLFRAAELLLQRAFAGVCETEFALGFGVFRLEAFGVGGLAEGIGAEGADGLREVLALSCVALEYVRVNLLD